MLCTKNEVNDFLVNILLEEPLSLLNATKLKVRDFCLAGQPTSLSAGFYIIISNLPAIQCAFERSKKIS
jgi:hypothetical protein